MHSLDRLRGICALSVFLTHWLLWNDAGRASPSLASFYQFAGTVYEGISSVAWPRGGQHPAVVCFFVLSGFCVHGGFEKCRLGGGTVDWSDYFKRRFMRIMPVYWVGALLGLIVVLLQRWAPLDHALLQFHSQAGVGEIVARLGGFGGVWPHEIFVGNQTLCTVAVEILIYAGYPLFYIIAGKKWGWWALGLGSVMVYVSSLWWDDFIDPYVVYSSVFVGSLLWFCGAWVARVFYRGGCSISWPWVLGAWVCFALINQLPIHTGGGLLRQALWAVICGLIIYWLVTRERNMGNDSEGPVAKTLRWWGDISYPLYAVHTPIILIVIWIGFERMGPAAVAVQWLVSLALPIFIAQWVHRHIENRFMVRHSKKGTNAKVKVSAEG